MKVFQSLNCVVCKLPFARKANEARSPRPLDCGSAMCHECFEKERRLAKEKREHQCVRKQCFNNANFAFYLIDVLSQEDSLTLSPLGDGYLLVKKLTLKEENSKSISTFGEAKKTLEKCAKLREDFETISEKLMPHLRRYETKVKTLTERIDKDDYQGLKDGFEE
ncbi:unnamed protein product, partial [Mesorhabditis belari]|uniref:Uncharacterized protein n=1 Tax=Mesorhabditis belari TaxID=2138241 RepID=A0AAF3EKY5_9BILA